MSLPDRALVANMSPEYGATMGYFPVDAETMRYLRQTGRSSEQIDLVETYCREQGFFREADSPQPEYTETLELDLGSVVPSLAGPKRPQDRVALDEMKSVFQKALTARSRNAATSSTPEAVDRKAKVGTNGGSYEIGHGAVVIAAITSCTNTSNPSVMVAAGLVAKKAAEKGLTVKPYVKTSLAPGSRVVTEYLKKADLIEPLAQVGFQRGWLRLHHLHRQQRAAAGGGGQGRQRVRPGGGGSHFGQPQLRGRVHPLVKANYLASPPLVVAYALAGTVDIDLLTEPVGMGKDGPVYLKDIWPTTAEVADRGSRQPEQGHVR